ncbi:flagellar biosynthetic protein FliR [Magnetococcales bacterium HHB-1]
MDLQAFADLAGFSTSEIQRIALIFARITGLFLSAPFFSRSVGPSRIRVMIAITLSFAVFPLVPAWPGEETATLLQLGWAVLVEILIGAVLGILAHWVLVSVQVAGMVVGFSMGLSMAMVMDPTSGVQEGVVSNLFYMISLILFLSIDGHHMLIEGIVRSYSTLPLGVGLSSEAILHTGTKEMARLFELAILISAPVLVATKMLYLGMGLINRASPQIQVFFLAMPLAQMIGFLILGLSMTVFAEKMMREMKIFITMAFQLAGIP